MQEYEKVTGVRHVFAAAWYSLGGFLCLLRETAFRHELALAGIVAVLFAIIGASGTQYLIFACLFLVLIAVEALNTAIELLVDRASPEISEFARKAKDLGSFAVFCLLAANTIFVFYVIGSNFL